MIRHTHKLCLLALVSLVAALAACNDQPTEIGSDFAIDTANAYAISSYDTLLITGAENARVPGFAGTDRPLFNAGLLYIGRGNGVEAHTILRFTTIPDSLETGRYTIRSATLVVHPLSYAFGDTAKNTLGFGIHEMLQPWGPSTTLDTLDSLQNAGLRLYGEQEFGRFFGEIPLRDSLPSIRIPLHNFDFLYRWIENERSIRACKISATNAADSAACDEQFGVYGLALLPKGESSVVRKFATQAIGKLDVDLSIIELVYQHADSSSLDTLNIEAGYDGTFVRAPGAESRTLTVQGGAALRSHLYFDVSMIPPLSQIHKAEFRLTLDPTRSQYGSGNAAFDGATLTFARDSSYSITSRERITARKDTESDQYIFTNIGRWVERWNRSGANHGLVLHVEENREFSQMNRLVFHAPDALDSAKRPYLRILYRTRPK